MSAVVAMFAAWAVAAAVIFTGMAKSGLGLTALTTMRSVSGSWYLDISLRPTAVDLFAFATVLSVLAVGYSYLVSDPAYDPAAMFLAVALWGATLIWVWRVDLKTMSTGSFSWNVVKTTLVPTLLALALWIAGSLVFTERSTLVSLPALLWATAISRLWRQWRDKE